MNAGTAAVVRGTILTESIELPADLSDGSGHARASRIDADG
jgi:hypothetical protein